MDAPSQVQYPTTMISDLYDEITTLFIPSTVFLVLSLLLFADTAAIRQFLAGFSHTGIAALVVATICVLFVYGLLITQVADFIDTLCFRLWLRLFWNSRFMQSFRKNADHGIKALKQIMEDDFGLSQPPVWRLDILDDYLYINAPSLYKADSKSNARIVCARNTALNLLVLSILTATAGRLSHLEPGGTILGSLGPHWLFAYALLLTSILFASVCISWHLASMPFSNVHRYYAVSRSGLGPKRPDAAGS